MSETRKVDNNKIRTLLFVNLRPLDMRYLKEYFGSTGVGNGPSERNPARTKANFVLLRNGISF